MRITTTVARVLRIFLEDTDQPRYGFELMQHTGIASGTLYPILARLESAGWITGQRETVDPAEVRRPPRRFYLITAEGALAASRELARLSTELRPPVAKPWAPPRESPA